MVSNAHAPGRTRSVLSVYKMSQISPVRVCSAQISMVLAPYAGCTRVHWSLLPRPTGHSWSRGHWPPAPRAGEAHGPKLNCQQPGVLWPSVKYSDRAIIPESSLATGGFLSRPSHPFSRRWLAASKYSLSPHSLTFNMGAEQPTKVRPWRAMIINCVLRCGFSVSSVTKTEQTNELTSMRRDVWGHLKTSGDSRFSWLSAITEWSLDPDPLQARAKHTAAPWACTLQTCQGPAPTTTCGDKDETEAGVTRGASDHRMMSDIRIRKRKPEPTHSRVQSFWELEEVRSAKSRGKWGSPVSPAGPCLVQIRTLCSPKSRTFHWPPISPTTGAGR